MQHAVRTSTARTPVVHIAEQWSGYCERYARRTQEIYSRNLREFLAYIKPKYITDIKPIDIQVFVNSLLRNHNHRGVNCYIITIKSFCRWLSDTYDIPNPALKLRQYRSDSEEARCLSPEEYQKCLQGLTGRDLAIVKFLANTGLRVTELQDLTPSSIKGNWLVIKGKGSKTRLIPLNNHATESLRILFNFSRNHSIIRRRCYRIAKKLGLRPFGPHALRHFLATRLLSPPHNVPIHRVSKLLGHSSVRLTESIYWHFAAEHLTGLTDGLD